MGMRGEGSYSQGGLGGSGIEQRESVIHVHICSLFKILFPYRSLQSIEWSSLCYTVGPY